MIALLVMIGDSCVARIEIPVGYDGTPSVRTFCGPNCDFSARLICFLSAFVGDTRQGCSFEDSLRWIATLKAAINNSPPDDTDPLLAEALKLEDTFYYVSVLLSVGRSKSLRCGGIGECSLGRGP